jgi:hypothetical protein
MHRRPTMKKATCARAARCRSQTHADPTTVGRLFHIKYGGSLRRVPPLIEPPDELRRRLDKTELRQGRNAVIETDLLDDLAVLEFEHGCSGELHLATGVGGQ